MKKDFEAGIMKESSFPSPLEVAKLNHSLQLYFQEPTAFEQRCIPNLQLFFPFRESNSGKTFPYLQCQKSVTNTQRKGRVAPNFQFSAAASSDGSTLSFHDCAFHRSFNLHGQSDPAEQ